MRYLLFALREILPAVAVLVPAYLILHKIQFRDMGRTLTCFLFSAYLCGMYVLVGLPNVTYMRFEWNLNLIPFAGMLDGLRDTVLNILLFIPLGVFLPLLWHKFRGMGKTVFFGFGMSLAIELLQIFTYRATDVNDLITNTLGTALGFFLGKLLRRILPMQISQNIRDSYIVFGLAFCIMFFLQPVLVVLL